MPIASEEKSRPRPAGTTTYGTRMSHTAAVQNFTYSPDRAIRGPYVTFGIFFTQYRNLRVRRSFSIKSSAINSPRPGYRCEAPPSCTIQELWLHSHSSILQIVTHVEMKTCLLRPRAIPTHASTITQEACDVRRRNSEERFPDSRAAATTEDPTIYRCFFIYTADHTIGVRTNHSINFSTL